MRRALALAHARAAQPPPHAARVRACACACADDALVGDRAVAALVSAADGDESDALPVLTVLQKALWYAIVKARRGFRPPASTVGYL